MIPELSAHIASFAIEMKDNRREHPILDFDRQETPSPIRCDLYVGKFPNREELASMLTR